MRRTKSTKTSASAKTGATPKVHLLDVGENAYGDSLLCELAGTTVLIDGAHPENYATRGIHPAIPDQIGQLLSRPAPPYHIDLLIVSHAHADHIGCLPKLVADGTITVTWAFVVDPDRRWGAPATAGASDAARLVANALQEEVQPPSSDATALDRFITDTAALEPAYRKMLDDLRQAGTTVVRHGTDDPAALLGAFASIGLQILGPSVRQLNITAAALGGIATDAARAVDALLRQDASQGLADVYRRLAWSTRSDAIQPDAQAGGAMVNLQSSVVVFNVGNTRLLFNGDMQLASTGSSDQALTTEVEALVALIEAQGPFSFFKLSHHGSYNGMDAQIFEGLHGTRVFGICGGEKSPSHPDPSILQLLSEATTDGVQWVRTDHNGQSSVTLSDPPAVVVSRGTADDSSPAGDARALTTARAQVVSTSAEPGILPAVAHLTSTEGTIEVVTRVPTGSGRTRITIEIEQPGTSGERTNVVSARVGDVQFAANVPALRFAGGRQLPPLLFVTNREGLAANIGTSEATAALAAIKDAGHVVLADLPGNGTWAETMDVMARSAADAPGVKGVVLIGGYDIVPSQRLDCLPSRLRQQLPTGNEGFEEGDLDDFMIWSDAAYGALRGNVKPRLPVSRIPDALSAALVFAALSASDTGSLERRGGIRNKMRPFADDVFASLPGSAALGISEPVRSTSSFPLSAERVYLMLHGHYSDTSRFAGEADHNVTIEALNIGNIPKGPAPKVVFAGCCWGALTVDQIASQSPPAETPSPRTADASIALTYLARGAVAFVGCTGAHYSPDTEPYAFFGGPLHSAFWESYGSGSSPAEALLAAKAEFSQGMFHEQIGPVREAIEWKTLYQFTCLGLGW